MYSPPSRGDKSEARESTRTRLRASWNNFCFPQLKKTSTRDIHSRSCLFLCLIVLINLSCLYLKKKRHGYTRTIFFLLISKFTKGRGGQLKNHYFLLDRFFLNIIIKYFQNAPTLTTRECEGRQTTVLRGGTRNKDSCQLYITFFRDSRRSETKKTVHIYSLPKSRHAEFVSL